MIVAHVTHEAVENIGGIGTVISGLVTTDAYHQAVSRTFLVGPKFDSHKTMAESLGPEGKVLYCPSDNVQPADMAAIFSPIEQKFRCEINYGRRMIVEPYSGRCEPVEVILVDVRDTNSELLNTFKGRLFDNFGVASDKFEKIWEYEQYIRLAEPACDAIAALVGDSDRPQVYLSHEYMGMATALKAKLDIPGSKSFFYAHEVASVRPIVEKNPGHDTMFYNVMEAAHGQGLTLEDVFPQVKDNFKHPLVKAAKYCDGVLAVGDYVRKELEFLSNDFTDENVSLVYNGIPHHSSNLAARLESRELLQSYAQKLLGYKPTWIFTHVARPVLSKGIWRDLRILHELEPILLEKGETAVYFMLGTLGGTRRRKDVLAMENQYSWPVVHQKGYPDLSGGEDTVSDNFDAFNATHHASRAILINQWGFNAYACGTKMPEKATIADLRRGADMEFGMSVYEPFGISQLEPLTYGALCLISEICGCAGFARLASKNGGFDNIIYGDFVSGAIEFAENVENGLHKLLSLGVEDRDLVEIKEGKRLAEIVNELLPRSDGTLQGRLESGLELAERMNWQFVVSDMLLKAIKR